MSDPDSAGANRPAEMVVVPLRRRWVGPVPAGLNRLPGPTVLIAERFTHSAAGAYVSLAIGEPVRKGRRWGWYFSTLVVNSADAVDCARANWGGSPSLGTLMWSSDAQKITITWAERDIQIVAWAQGRPLPIWSSSRKSRHAWQSRFKGLLRRGRVTVDVAMDDPLFRLAGPHLGFVVAGRAVVGRGGGRKIGLLDGLRAPVRPVKPGVAGLGHHSKPAS